MSFIPSSYTTEDRDLISSNYADMSAVATAIENHDESIASVEDLLSYYIESNGSLPDFMQAGVLSPEDAELQALWGDAEFAEVVQDWRRLSVGGLNTTQLVDQLTAFLNTGADAGFTANEINEVTDIQNFLNEYKANHAGQPTEAEESGSMLAVNLANLMMKLGNPGLAILLMITGSTTSETVPTDPNNLPDYMVLNADGQTVTIKTAEGPVQAKLGEKVTFKTLGFGNVIQNAQDDVLNHMQDMQQEISDMSDDLANLDPSNPEDEAEANRIRQDIQNYRNFIEIDKDVLEYYQNMIDSLLDLSSSLTDKQFRTASGIINRI